MRGRHLAVALLCIAASCKPPPTARSAEKPPGLAHDEPTTPAAPIAATSPPAGAASGAPADTPALAPDAAPALAPVDVRTVDGVAEFLRRMCERASAGDADWVQAHVALPLTGNVWIDENAGDPLLAPHMEDDAASVARLGICLDPAAPGSEVRGLTVEAERVTAVIAIDGFDHRLAFALANTAEPRLVELDFVLPDVRLPAPRKKAPRKHIVTGRVKEGTDGFGGMVEVSILGELERRPACIRQHFARSHTSATLSVAVSKVDGKDAAVRVYASSVAPASLVRCLEMQLGKALAKLFRGVPFEVAYHLMVMMPVPKNELDDDVPTLMFDGDVETMMSDDE